MHRSPHPSVETSGLRAARRPAVAGLCLAVTGGVLGAAPTQASTPPPSGAAHTIDIGAAGAATAVRQQLRAADDVHTPVLREQSVPTLAPSDRFSLADGPTVTLQQSRARRVVAALPRQTSRPFETVAVTWAHDSAPADIAVQVQVRRGGKWTGWEALEYEPEEGPAASEDTGLRDGTASWWTGPADGVAVRATSATGEPQDLSVLTIDDPAVSADPSTAALDANATAGSSRSGADVAGTTSAAALAAPTLQAVTTSSTSSGASITGSPAFPKQPRVVTRRQWGANESLRSYCSSPRVAKTTKMVFIHHTVNDNDYTRAESPAVVRGIYAYHTQGQGWCDIGYNFLVDRFGTIYQGRKGGIQRPVRGAHAGDYNVGTVGISLMGNFEQRRPSHAMKNAVVRLVGWKLGTNYRAPRSGTRVYGDRFRRISGHRDAMQTACPGYYAYAWLPTLRRRVGAYLSDFNSPLERKADALGNKRTGVVHIGEEQLGFGRRTSFTRGTMLGRSSTGAHFLSGAVLARYRDVNGVSGPLGLPVSDFFRSKAGVRTMAFDRGRMYVLPGDKVKALWGRILLRWVRSNGFGGRLGAPRTSVLHRSYGQKAWFAGGTIRYERAGDRIVVTYR